MVSEQIDQQSLTRWIEKSLGRSGAFVRRPLSGGNANLTLLLGSDDGDLVLRTPPADSISPNAQRGIEREARVMSALAGQLKVPRVLAWCDDTEVIGRPFLLVEHIDGVAITDALPAAYADPVDTVNQLGLQLTDELATLHGIEPAEVGLADLGNANDFLRRNIDRWQKIRSQQSVRKLPLLDELADWMRNNLPQVSSAAIVHGDYHIDNTLCRTSGPELAAVIDWELSTLGDPLTDLGLFLMFWGPRRTDPPAFRHVQAVTRARGVVSRRTLAERWSERTKLAIDQLDFYLCFAFWRLAAIVEGAWILQRQGKVDTAYSRGLEYDVPALLLEARDAANGDW
tara:strand:- start:796 stop:1821 length:1026 start_codon:yes stop_codon:yes gene_type:complete